MYTTHAYLQENDPCVPILYHWDDTFQAVQRSVMTNAEFLDSRNSSHRQLVTSKQDFKEGCVVIWQRRSIREDEFPFTGMGRHILMKLFQNLTHLIQFVLILKNNTQRYLCNSKMQNKGKKDCRSRIRINLAHHCRFCSHLLGILVWNVHHHILGLLLELRHVLNKNSMDA